MNEDLKKWADEFYQKTKSGEYTPKESLNEFLKHSQEWENIFFDVSTENELNSEEMIQSDVSDCVQIVCKILSKAAQVHPDAAHFEATLGSDDLLAIIVRQENTEKEKMDLGCFIPEEQGISKEEYRMLEGVFCTYRTEPAFWQQLKATVEKQLCEDVARRYTICISE